jgi:hypothetical protein
MNDELEIINPPNLLKSKVKAGGPGAVDADTLNRAEAAIADMADQYLEWVVQDLDRIGTAFDNLKSASEENVPAKLEVIFQVSHDIKGQGGSFGYDMMTSVGNQLCRIIENSEPTNPKLVEAISVHIETMKLVIAQRIKGSGGSVGEQMLRGLEQIFKKTTGQ